MVKIIKENTFQVFILTIIAVWSIFPILKNPTQSFFYGGDDAIVTWILNQTIQKIPNNLSNIFQTNIFYPYKNTLAFGVMLIPTAFITYLPTILTGSHITAYNTAIIFAQFTTVFLIYFWFLDMSDKKWSSLLATCAFSFSIIRMSFIVHSHFFYMQWVVAAGWMLWRFSKNGKLWQLYLTGLFLIIQTWESMYQVFWILLFAIVFFGSNLDLIKKSIKHIIIISILVLLLTYPVLHAYYFVVKTYGYSESIRETANFSLSLDGLWRTYLSPGLYVTFAASIFFLNKKLINNKNFKMFLIISLFSLIMALGPVLKVHGQTFKFFGNIFIPLPYAIFYYLIPGFGALRSVHRWVWLFGFGLSTLSLLSISNLEHKKYFTIFFTALLLLILATGKNITHTKSFPLPKDYPHVYEWLKEQNGNVVLQLPIYSWNDYELHGIEMYRMVYSLKHKKQLINGADGFMPEERGILLENVKNNYPTHELNSQLKDLGVDYIIVNKNLMDYIVLKKTTKSTDLTKIYDDTEFDVFRLN